MKVSRLMGKTVFITGANGFIGGRVAEKLAERGYEVVCLVRDPDKVRGLKSRGMRLVKGDITDRGSLQRTMIGADAVFHIAGLYTVGERDTARMHAINVDGARNALEVAAELGVSKILHTSTVGVFGNTKGKIVDESYRALREEMISAYELTKWLAHYQVAESLQNRGAPVIILQPGGVTGAGDESPHMMVFEMFVRRSPVMLGAKSGLTFAHVDDIAEGHILALEKGKPGESYILAGEALTYRGIFEKLEKISGRSGAKLWLPGSFAGMSAAALRGLEQIGLRGPYSSEALAAMNDYTYWAKADKAQRELGWSHRPTEETFADTLTYLDGEAKRGSPRQPV